MFKHAIALIVLAALAAPAGAVDIHLDWTTNYVGDGLWQYKFYIRNDDGLSASYAATMAFVANNGLINQETVMGNGAYDVPTADFLAGFGLNKERDTFSLSPFEAAGSIPGNSLLNGDTFSGYREGDNYFEFSVGTGAGSAYGDNTPLAQIVADAPVYWIGTIARGTSLVTLEPVLTPGSFGVDSGDYTIAPGETLQLQATPDGYIADLFHDVAWDLDYSLTGTSDYETSVGGLAADVSYDHLMSLGLQPGNTYNIRFSADYTSGAGTTTKYTGATLTITPEPATMAMLALGATALLRRKRS